MSPATGWRVHLALMVLWLAVGKRTDPLLHYLLRRAERPTEVAE